MGVNNGKIVNEVSLADISQVMHYASLDLGTLASYSGQNRWTKCKSFHYPEWGFASPAAELAARRSKNCGLVMRDYGNNTALYAAMVAGGDWFQAWLHDVPTGGASAPYRILDYLGYDENAAAPFQFSLYPNPCYKTDSPRISDEGGAGVADIDVADLLGDGTASANHGNNYKYYDIRSLYIGVMYGAGASVPSHAYTLGTLSNWSPIQNIPKPSATGDYYAVVFLSDKQFSGQATDTNGVFIPAPIGMKVWHYSDTLGVSYSGCEIDSLRAFLHMVLTAIGRNKTYYKLTVLVKNGSTIINSIDLDHGQSGTLYYSSATDFGSVRINPAAPSNATFWLRYWTTSSNYYDEQFYPEETPV